MLERKECVVDNQLIVKPISLDELVAKSKEGCNLVSWSSMSGWLSSESGLFYTYRADPCFAGVAVREDLHLNVFHTLPGSVTKLARYLKNEGTFGGVVGTHVLSTGFSFITPLVEDLGMTVILPEVDRQKLSFNLILNPKTRTVYYAYEAY